MSQPNNASKFVFTGRVTVECRLAEPAQLFELQDQLSGLLTSFRPKSRQDLHLTVFHFGVPDEIYRQLKAVNRPLSRDQFDQAFQVLLAACDGIIVDPFILTDASLVSLGHPRQPVVALEFEPPDWLVEKHRQIASWWLECLQACDISQELKSDRPFRPHVSLGRLQDHQQLPVLAVKDLWVRFEPSRLRNVEKIKD
jgi:2'-5' RNA ligase